MILSTLFFSSEISRTSVSTLFSIGMMWWESCYAHGKTRWKRKESLKSPWRFPRRLEEWRSWDGWLRMKKSGKRLRWMSTQWNSRLHNMICNKYIYIYTCSVETVEIYIYVYIRVYTYIHIICTHHKIHEQQILMLHRCRHLNAGWDLMVMIAVRHAGAEVGVEFGVILGSMEASLAKSQRWDWFGVKLKFSLLHFTSLLSVDDLACEYPVRAVHKWYAARFSGLPPQRSLWVTSVFACWQSELND